MCTIHNKWVNVGCALTKMYAHPKPHVRIVYGIILKSVFIYTIHARAQFALILGTAYMEPDRLQKRYRRRRSTANSGGGTDDDSSLRHDSSSSASGSKRSKRAIPHIIYPEILVIVDYDGYRLHGGDNVQVRISNAMHSIQCNVECVYVVFCFWYV